jgi:hypothetical protein
MKGSPVRVQASALRLAALLPNTQLAAAEVESEHALRGWFVADAPQGAGAYLAYRAAVDREEAAARDLQRVSELTQPYQERLARSQ